MYADNLCSLPFVMTLCFLAYSGQATDIQIQAEEILKLKRRLNEIYVEHTGKSLKDIEDNLERDRFMSATEAMEYGLIDSVIAKRPSKDEGSDE